MEEWRDVPGYEGLYQISISTSEGKCRRIYKTTGKKELINTHNGNGYITWVLTKNCKSKSAQAARWIALTYPELVQNEWFEGAEIDHIDTNRLNNHPSNLQWTDRSGNLQNPITKANRSKSLKGLQNSLGKGKEVQQFKNDVLINEFKTLSLASEITGVNVSNISACCSGRKKTAGGYVWKYKREAV